MGRQIYTTRDVVVGATKIKVRQPIFKGRDGVDVLIRNVLTEARRLVNETVDLCNPSGAVKDIKSGAFIAKVPHGLFQKLFLAPPSHQLLSTVWENLGRIQYGLNEPFGLKTYTQGDGSTNGYVNKYFPISRMIKHTGSDGKVRDRISFGSIHFGRCARVDGAALHDARYGEALVGRGDIHVSFERLNSPMGPKTLIHEAAHKFANRGDFSYMYDFQYAKAITAADTLLNADSYAWLCFLAPSAASATANRRHNQAAAQSDDAMDGVSALFG